MNVHQRFKGILFLALLVCVSAANSVAHAASTSARDETAIRKVLDSQVEAWNRGDVVAFMQGYKDSPDTAFVGKTVEHGFANILARYQKKYGSKEQMGRLTFSEVQVTQLDAYVATVTGRFHLARNATGGGDAEGIFSLVFEKTTAGWKIVLDHTS